MLTLIMYPKGVYQKYIIPNNYIIYQIKHFL